MFASMGAGAYFVWNFWLESKKARSSISDLLVACKECTSHSHRGRRVISGCTRQINKSLNRTKTEELFYRQCQFLCTFSKQETHLLPGRTIRTKLQNCALIIMMVMVMVMVMMLVMTVFWRKRLSSHIRSDLSDIIGL